MIIQSKKVWIADQFISAAVELEQGKITGIFPYGEKQADVDYGSKRIVPGFMDIHCHGAYEFDTNDAKPEGLRYWAKHIVSEGVTSFLATTVTQSVEVLTNAVANVADVMEGSYEGAEILGIHFEGPYLDMKYKGAQPPEYIAQRGAVQALPAGSTRPHPLCDPCTGTRRRVCADPLPDRARRGGQHRP